MSASVEDSVGERILKNVMIRGQDGIMRERHTYIHIYMRTYTLHTTYLLTYLHTYLQGLITA